MEQNVSVTNMGLSINCADSVSVIGGRFENNNSQHGSVVIMNSTAVSLSGIRVLNNNAAGPDIHSGGGAATDIKNSGYPIQNP